jgi:hypothetical protein
MSATFSGASTPLFNQFFGSIYIVACYICGILIEVTAVVKPEHSGDIEEKKEIKFGFEINK